MTYGDAIFAGYYAQHSLPAGYRRVEYLESTGLGNGAASQYIDTGIIPANTYVSGRVSYMYLALPATPEAIMGGTVSDSSSNLRIGINTRKYRLKWNNEGYTGDSIIANAVYSDAFNTSQGFLSNGALTWNKHIESNSAMTRTVLLFCDYDYSMQGGIGYNHVNKRVYSCEFEQNNILVRNLIPCARIADNKPGMYDLCGSICPITNSPFYINSGTGADFMWGEL